MNHQPKRRMLLASAALAVPLFPMPFARAAQRSSDMEPGAATLGDSITFTRMAPPAWLMAFWKEIDDKTWGKGFDCFAQNAVAHLGVSDWHGREGIRKGLRDFVDRNLTASHDVTEYWDSPRLKVFRGFVTMVFNDKRIPTARPAMQHFFYMDETDPGKVAAWFGSVGPTAF